MLITDIYSKYQIPLNLQKHMLRVAALGSLICQSFKDTQVNSELIIKALLLHDMTNIIKFDFTLPEMLEPEDRAKITELQKRKEDFIQKYGSDVHKALLLLLPEIIQDQKIINLINVGFWERAKILSEQKNKWEEKIYIYSDVRIGPHGILSMRARYDNLMKRRPQEAPMLEKLFSAFEQIERQIQSNCSIDLQTITDTDLEALFEILKQTSF